jgi:hypothetical protein
MLSGNQPRSKCYTSENTSCSSIHRRENVAFFSFPLLIGSLCSPHSNPGYFLLSSMIPLPKTRYSVQNTTTTTNTTTLCFKKHVPSVKDNRYPSPPSEFDQETTYDINIEFDTQLPPTDMSATRDSSIVPETPPSTAPNAGDGMGTRGKTAKLAAQANTGLLATVEAALKTVKQGWQPVGSTPGLLSDPNR